MVDLQHEPDVRDRLVASSDDEHLPGTTGFDENQNVSNVRTAPTDKKLPMGVEPPSAPPRPANFSRDLRALILIIVVVSFILVYEKWMHADESDQPYNKQEQTKSENKSNRLKPSGNCVVPEYPEHGKYIILNAPTAKPGESLNALKLTVNCLPNYRVLGTDVVLCVDGSWSDSCPKCVRFCNLENNTSVRYHCLVTGSIEGRRNCNAYEPSGTVVTPECNSPNYSFIALPSMRCINGTWDHVADCSPECGRVTSDGVDLMTDGRPAERGELPWHVGVYRKHKTPCPLPCTYKQICGGSIVSNSVVISAAHCFWDDFIKQLPASMFAAAAGKIYRGWNDQRDKHAQKSEVKEINIPARFQGDAANFQDDIAVVILETSFKYTPFVGHVCLSFNFDFETTQLQHGTLGKVAGWGLTAENGNASRILKVVQLPYVDIKQCIKASPQSFKGHLTSDKICAGYKNGTALCKGDSGGGLVFPDAGRYYLRGIVSTAPRTENRCNIHALTAFTQILKHEHFIKSYI